MSTPFGGGCTNLVMGTDDVPQVTTPLAIGYGYELYGARRNGTWQFSRFPGGVMDAVDSKGRPHVVTFWTIAPSRYDLRHLWLDSGTWHNETVEANALARYPELRWYSMVIDSEDRPHILYYDSVRGDVRYAFQNASGWHVEVVEHVGFIQYGGKHGSMALAPDGTPHAVYWADVDYFSNRGSLRHAVRSSGWNLQTLEAPPGMKGRFPNVAVDPFGTVHVAAIDWDILNPANNSFLADLRYATLTQAGWAWETVYAGYQYIRSPTDYQVRLPDFPSMVVDRCGNPHIAFYLNWITGLDTSQRGVYYATKGEPCSSDRPPVADAGGPYVGVEGTPLLLNASRSSDSDGDTLRYRWDFGDDGAADTPWSPSPTVEHTWPDDWDGTVRVEVSDGNATSNATARVTILNLPPRIAILRSSVAATATLRIAGEKWHDVAAFLVEGGNETLLARLVRASGKPQEATVPLAIDPTKASAIRIAYTPSDDPPNGQGNGATPAWLNLTFESGPPASFHHTFNARHPETWNWTVDLGLALAGRAIAFTATATDPGSDGLTFAWDFGDGSPAVTATFPDVDGAFPFTATDTETHAYAAAGAYRVTLRVTDDDGGSSEVAIVVSA